MSKLILFAIAATASAVFLVSGAGAARPGPGCTSSLGSVSLDQSYAVSAWGLPTHGTVNMIVTYPNGSTSTGPVSVASDGTYTLNQSSANGIAPEQTGTYAYQFVGKVKWPEGSFNQSYASCTAQVG
jgi:hypothetical protein